MDTGAWQATVQGVKKSWTQLKRLTTHAHYRLTSQKMQASHSDTKKSNSQSDFFYIYKEKTSAVILKDISKS